MEKNCSKSKWLVVCALVFMGLYWISSISCLLYGASQTFDTRWMQLEMSASASASEALLLLVILILLLVLPLIMTLFLYLSDKKSLMWRLSFAISVIVSYLLIFLISPQGGTYFEYSYFDGFIVAGMLQLFFWLFYWVVLINAR